MKRHRIKNCENNMKILTKLFKYLNILSYLRFMDQCQVLCAEKSSKLDKQKCEHIFLNKNQ